MTTIGPESAAAGTVPAHAWRDRLAVGLVFTVAATIRFWGIWNSGFIHWDEYVFVHQGRDLAANWWEALHRLVWNAGPVTSLLIGGAMAVFGPSETVALSTTALCGSLACVATAILAQRCGANRSGVLAGLFLAVSPFAFTYSRLALAESPFLLLFVLVLICLWDADHTRSLAIATIGGVLTGLLTFTKYDGVYGLLLAISWFAAKSCWSRWTRVATVRGRPQPTRAALVAAWVIAFAAVTTALIPLIANSDGFALVVASIRAHAALGADPRIVLAYLSGQTAAPIVAAAACGMVTALVRRREGDVFLVLVFSTFLAALALYVPYPRLGLPLAPIGAILAANAVDWFAQRLKTHGAFSAIGIALLLAQLPTLVPIVRMRTRGYADVAGIVASTSPTVAVWSRSQMSLMLYTDRPRWLQCTPDVGRSLALDQERLLILDQAATWSGFASDLLTLNADQIAGETRVANPMYTELLLQPFTWEMWAQRDSPPPAYRFIRLIRTRGPLRMPAECR
jgi:hypothetical protein